MSEPAIPPPSEGCPASWVRVVLRVSPEGEMHAIGGDRDGSPDDGDCPYPGLDRINARIKQVVPQQMAKLQSDMQEMDQRRTREYQALSDENARLQSAYRAAESERDRLAERLRRAEEILRGVANHGVPKFNRQIAAFLAESPTEKQA